VKGLTKWRKSEGGIVGRFGDPRRALKSVALIVSDGEENPARQSFVVDQGLRLKDLRPRLIPKIDLEHLGRLKDEVKDSLGVCLVLRDPSVKQFSLVGDWRISELPESIPLEKLCGFERIVSARMIISVGLSVLDENAQFDVGTTLARKDFSIHTDAKGNQFPHLFVDPSYFEKEGLPNMTSWYVHIFNEDGDRPAEETFIVYINRELSTVSATKGADAIWAALAADVFSILIQCLLRGEIPVEPTPGTIMGSLERQLSALNLNFQTVSSWVKTGELSKIVAVSQAITRVNFLLRGAL
jgi:hypothetical protein